LKIRARFDNPKATLLKIWSCIVMGKLMVKIN
jgi:hypothetical protein